MSGKILEARLWREPLFHFVVLGAAVFAIDRATAQPDEPDTIVLSEAFVSALEQEEARRSGNATTERMERAALVARYIREEALFREANRLGLDRGDVIVRRRLVQKMEFLLRSAARVGEPNDDELQTYLEQHASRFTQPARVGFTHVFFEAGQDERAREVGLQLDDEVERAEQMGDPFLLGYALPPHTHDWVASRFGEPFAAALDEAPEGRWSGPVTSALGLHWVRVNSRAPASQPVLADVRVRVRRAWEKDREDAAFERALERLVSLHPVERVDAP